MGLPLTSVPKDWVKFKVLFEKLEILEALPAEVEAFIKRRRGNILKP